MRVVRVDRDVPLVAIPNEITLALSAELPPAELITCVFALAFAGERLLMTCLRDRGWDIPGGHVEAGEAMLDALRREVREETGVMLSGAAPLGFQRVRLLGAKPPEYRYPYPDSYMV